MAPVPVTTSSRVRMEASVWVSWRYLFAVSCSRLVGSPLFMNTCFRAWEGDDRRA